MMDHWEELNLENIGDGRAVGLFQEEFHRVAADIKDPDKVLESPRTITLKFNFKPVKGGKGAVNVDIAATSTLGKSEPMSESIHIATTEDGKKMTGYRNRAKEGEIPGMSGGGALVPDEKGSGLHVLQNG